MRTPTEMDRLREAASAILGTDHLTVVSKRFAELYLSDTHVLKFAKLEGLVGQGLTGEFKYLRAFAPEVDAKFYPGSSAQGLCLRMRRLLPESQLSQHLYSCECQRADLHLRETMCDLVALRTPVAEHPAREVLDALQNNVKRQSNLDEYLPEYQIIVHDLIKDAEENIRFLANEPIFATGASIEVDLHGNLFSTNVWRVDDKFIALDPTSRSLLPSSLRLVGIIVDFILLHPVRLKVAALRSALELLAPEDELLFLISKLALVVKLLVRIRFATAEILLADTEGWNRRLDTRIIATGRAGILSVQRLLEES
ncbi:hypothetical protein EDF36_3302 [Rathayibacter sp. PhB152]|nr:hypothetical protein EDF36_3302 [Rathayibacter sp. PhB152]